MLETQPWRGWLFAIAMLITAVPSAAQSEEEAVLATIERLFDGMRAGDSTMVRSTLHEGAMMSRATDQGFGFMSADGFVRAVGSPRDQVWDEKIWDVVIQIDQRLASAWMEFAFYLGEDLHHCGVNSMHLYKTDHGWKIAHLADTNRGLDCDIPDDL